MSRLAIVTTHPIQYHAAWFRALAMHDRIDLEVFFCHKATPKEQADAGFGVEFDWDVSLLEGYPHRFLNNVSAEPSVNTFAGLNTPEIAQIIKKGGFDAVMINGWHYKSAWQAMRASRKNGTPVMLRSDSHLHTERPLLKRIAKRHFYEWFISRLDACLPVGEWSKEYFLHYGARPDRIFIVPHVVDTDYFCRESSRLLAERDLVRAQWGLESNAVVFLFAGKFIEKKRPMDFVRAVGDAAREQSRVAGLMVGDGPLRLKCEQFAVSNNYPIKFAGFLNQSQIAKAYVAADALILPSDGGETWGLVVNEAMACGLPCFVSDQVGCGPDLVSSNETGYIFRKGDTDALASLVQYSGNDPASLNTMGERARTQTGQYSVASGVEHLVIAVDAITARRKSR